MPCHLAAQTDSIMSAHRIDEVEVVGVSKQNIYRNVSPVYTLSASDFHRLNVSDVSTALRRLPGITLRDYGGAGGMKTISVRGVGSQHSGVALGGLLLPEFMSGQIDFQQFQLSELSSLSLQIGTAVDIFQPARNFSKASVVSVNTADSTHSRAALVVGSWGLLSPSFSFCRKMKNVSALLNGGYSYAENDYPFLIKNGVATHRERRQNSRMKQGYVNAAASAQLSGSVYLRGMLRYVDNDRQLPGIVRLYSNGNDETLHDKSTLAQVLITAKIAENAWLKSAVRWYFTQQDYHKELTAAGIRSEKYTQNEYYITSSLLYKPADGLDVDYSADLWKNNLSMSRQLSSDPKRQTPIILHPSFMQAFSVKWSRGRAEAVGQVLHSCVDKEQRLSPALAASYALTEDRSLNIRLSYKDIFRMPTATEKYYFHLGSQNLQPETTRQVNLGLTFRSAKILHQRLQLGLIIDTYINNVYDKIVAVPYNMFVWQYVNLSKVRGRGVDFVCNADLCLSAGHTLMLTSNYSFQSIENRTDGSRYMGNQVAYIPVHSGSGSLSWLNPWVNISVTGTAASHTWTTTEHHDGTLIEGYAELAATAYRSFRIRNGFLEGAVTVQNVLNADYCIVAHYPMPGRNWKISITYKF